MSRRAEEHQPPVVDAEFDDDVLSSPCEWCNGGKIRTDALLASPLAQLCRVLVGQRVNHPTMVSVVVWAPPRSYREGHRKEPLTGDMVPGWSDMHEMAITRSVVDAVCEHAAGRRVHSVRVRVGALCAVVPDSMRFCFDLATEGTVADGARLDLDIQPGSARCRACGADFSLNDPILLCPCGSADVEVLAGQDLRILSMEVS